MLVDTDDLINSHEVASILSLKNHRAVSVYASRYPDFPAPVVDKSSQCRLWWRPQIIEFKERIGRTSTQSQDRSG